MRRHTTIKISALALLFCAIALVHMNQHRYSPAPYESIRRTAKMLPPLEILMQKQENKPVLVGETVTLVATIKPSSTVGRVRWEWQSTRGAELLDTKTGYFDVESAEDEHQLQIRFKQISDKNELVHLRIYQNESSSQLVGAFSYNTLDQEKIEAETAQIIERQREYAEEMEGQTVLSSEAEANKNSQHEH